MPEHPVLEVARTGDPSAFVAEESALRRDLGFPPFGAVAELSGAAAAVAAAAAAVRAVGLTVVGRRRRTRPGAGVDRPSGSPTASPPPTSAPPAPLGRLRVAVDPPRV